MSQSLLALNSEQVPATTTDSLHCGVSVLAHHFQQLPRFTTHQEPSTEIMSFSTENIVQQTGDRQRWFDPISGALLLSLPADTQREPESTALEWTYSLDGPAVRLPDGTTRAFRHLSDIDYSGGYTVGVHVSPDQTRVLTAGAGDVMRGEAKMALRLWEIFSGKLLWEVRLPQIDRVLQARWAPDGRHIALATATLADQGPDRGRLFLLDTSNGARLWAVASEEPQRLVPGGSPSPFSDVVWSADASRIVVAYATSVRMLDARSGKKLERQTHGDGDFSTLTASPSARWLVVNRVNTGEALLLSLDGFPPQPLPYELADARFSDDSDFLVVHSQTDARLFALGGAPKEVPLAFNAVHAVEVEPALSSATLVDKTDPSVKHELPFSLNAPNLLPVLKMSGVGNGETRVQLPAPDGNARDVDLPTASRTLSFCTLHDAELECLEKATNGVRTLARYHLGTKTRERLMKLGGDPSQWVSTGSSRWLAQITPEPGSGAATVRVLDRVVRRWTASFAIPKEHWERVERGVLFGDARLDKATDTLWVVDGGWLFRLGLKDATTSRAYALIGPQGAPFEASASLTDGHYLDASGTTFPTCQIEDIELPSVACAAFMVGPQ